MGLRHLRTRPRRPQTNGKAERFIRTLLAGWAYGAIYSTTAERTAALNGWLFRYNHHRNHSAIGRKPPIARLNERNNLLGTYIPHWLPTLFAARADRRSHPSPHRTETSTRAETARPRWSTAGADAIRTHRPSRRLSSATASPQRSPLHQPQNQQTQLHS